MVWGRILEVDLTAKTWKFSDYSEDVVHSVLGGRGYNVWALYHHLPRGIDPLRPENILLISCGLLTGTMAPTSSRVHVSALSPLTGLLGSSNVGGRFGAALRSCQIQSLIIRGQAPEPVYLYIDHDGASFRDARLLWRLDTWETEEFLKQKLLDESIQMMVIGPGSENGALFGCIITDRDHAAGRTGMGTVMGSKNLKAVVVRERKQPTHQRNTIREREAITQYIRRIQHSAEYETFSLYGGGGYVQWCDDMGILGTRNYHENRFEHVDLVDGRRLRKYLTRVRGCYRCPIRCKAELQFHEGKGDEAPQFRPEFESMAAFGPRCGLRDLRTIVYLDNLCSRLGLDVISTGAAIAFAMDLYQRGILTSEDTGNLELRWGNGEVMETLIRQIAYQEGFGAMLSGGVRRAAQIIGNGAERFAPHVKGLELSAYHPREIMGTALGYAVASRGGDFSHVYNSLEYRWSPEKAAREFNTPLAVDIHAIQGKGLLVKRVMIMSTVLDCLGLCKVPSMSLMDDFDLKLETALTNAFTGLSTDADTLLKIGERVLTLERLFNLKHGATREDDRLPTMFLDAGPDSIPLDPMLRDFYTAMDWDEQGRPSEKKLQELGINNYQKDVSTA